MHARKEPDVLAACGELTLEALQPRHARAFLEQYRDPEIAAMAGLAPIATPAVWDAWMAEEARIPGRHNYAVMHERWGFVGVVGLHAHGDAAYFSFWIGCDYQGQGFGGAAARACWPLAARIGIRHIFTSTFAGNTRSRRVLERLGFEQFDLPTAGRDRDQAFYGLMPGHRPLAVKRLLALCEAIGGPIDLEPARQSASIRCVMERSIDTSDLSHV